MQRGGEIRQCSVALSTECGEEVAQLNSKGDPYSQKCLLRRSAWLVRQSNSDARVPLSGSGRERTIWDTHTHERVTASARAVERI